MRAAVALWNVVGEAVDVFLETVVPLQSDFHADAVFFGGEIEDVRVDRVFVFVQVLDEGFDAAFVVVVIALIVALVLKADRDAGVQERQLAQTLGENVVFEAGDVGKGFMARPEAHARAGQLGFADDRQRRLWHAVYVGLLMHFAFAADGQLQFFRKRVHHRHADAVQTAGNLIGVVVELTAGMQHGHDHFRRRYALFFVDTGRNAAAIVLHRYGIIGMDSHDNFFTVTRERFVDGVVHDLEYHVMQTGAVIRIADVHTRAFAYRIKPFQDFDT